MNISNVLIELKNKIELMLDLAYSALILQDKVVAEEVLKLEDYIDWLCTHFQLLSLSLFHEDGRKSEVLGLIRLSIAMENMADAAAKIAENILRGLELSSGKKLFALISEESEEFVSVATISSSSELVEKTIKESGIEKELDVQIIAVRRDNNWFIDPSETFRLKAGDVIVVRGYAEALDDVKRIAMGKK